MTSLQGGEGGAKRRMGSPNWRLGSSARINDLARYKARFVAAQERDHGRYVLRLPYSAQRDLRGGSDLERVEVDAEPLRRSPRHARLDETWRDGVDVDVERPELDCERARHALQAGLRGGV